MRAFDFTLVGPGERLVMAGDAWGELQSFRIAYEHSPFINIAQCSNPLIHYIYLYKDESLTIKNNSKFDINIYSVQCEWSLGAAFYDSGIPLYDGAIYMADGSVRESRIEINGWFNTLLPGETLALNNSAEKPIVFRVPYDFIYRPHLLVQQNRKSD